MTKSNSYVRDTLKQYLDSIYKASEKHLPELAVFSLVSPETIRQVQQISQKIDASKYTALVVLGIGGSSLGAQAYVSMLKAVENLKPVYFLDTPDELYLQSILSQISTEKTLFIFVSKSSTTLETLTLLEYLRSLEVINEANLYSVVSEKASYKQKIKEFSKEVFEISESLPGRFSVFSWVGLLPIYLAGGDISSFLNGASVSLSRFVSSFTSKSSESFLDNLALLYASPLNNRSAYVNFYSGKNLEQLNHWYRQLFSESLGKKENLSQQVFVTAAATEDFHSTLQMYLSQPDKYFFEFLELNHTGILNISESELLPKLKKTTLHDIKKSLIESVIVESTRHSIPVIRSEVSLSAKSLGSYMMEKILLVMSLGNLYGINAFNQPDIEEYKVNARKTIYNH